MEFLTAAVSWPLLTAESMRSPTDAVSCAWRGTEHGLRVTEPITFRANIFLALCERVRSPAVTGVWDHSQ